MGEKLYDVWLVTSPHPRFARKTFYRIDADDNVECCAQIPSTGKWSWFEAFLSVGDIYHLRKNGITETHSRLVAKNVRFKNV